MLKRNLHRICISLLLGVTVLSLSPNTLTAQETTEPVFGLPFAGDPGPSTWMFGQPYGNTTTAHRWRSSVYGAGQGMHFGIDISARCGTPIIAIGDGFVKEIDTHGSAPHSLSIQHDNGFVSFYGHLLERVKLPIGTEVKRGEQIALSGDPDRSCTSRPHLHLEIRRAPDMIIAYNPIPLIDADWNTIMLMSSFPARFQRDLTNPHQWQYIDEQPDVTFGWALLNNYEETWPLSWRQ